jgi:hypothetical protein
MTPCGCKAPIASRGPFLVLKRPSNTVGGESLGAAPVNRRALAPKGLTVILSAGAPNPLNTRCMSPLLKMNASARRSGRRCDGARRGFTASSFCNHQQGLFVVVGRTALGVIQTGMKAQQEASDNAARARNKVENTDEKITDQKNQQEIA